MNLVAECTKLDNAADENNKEMIFPAWEYTLIEECCDEGCSTEEMEESTGYVRTYMYICYLPAGRSVS